MEKNKITKEEVGAHIQVHSSFGGGKGAWWDLDTISLSGNTGNKGLGQMIHFQKSLRNKAKDYLINAMITQERGGLQERSRDVDSADLPSRDGKHNGRVCSSTEAGEVTHEL